jgi:hypothetical protein
MKLNIQNYNKRIEPLIQAHQLTTQTTNFLNLPTIEQLQLEILHIASLLKVADEYTTITKQFSNRRYARITNAPVIPPGPTLIELLLSETPIANEFLSVLSSQIDALPPANTYAYLVPTPHIGTTLFLILYYGLRRDVEHLKPYYRSQTIGSFSTGLQDLYGPDIKRNKPVLTFVFAIPNTTPNIKDIRRQESILIRSQITQYAQYMTTLRTSRLSSEDYKNNWLQAFTTLLKDLSITTATNRSPSFTQAHTDALHLEHEIYRLKAMIKALYKQ